MTMTDGWKRGDLAVYQGSFGRDDLTAGTIYVVNNAGRAHDATYLQIVTDDREVVDLLSTHFKLAAAPLPPAGEEWQPIETAPKDGTRVWLFYPEAHKDGRQVVGWFDTDARDGDRWMDHADAHDFIQPTNWRPLPSPPQARVRKEDR